MTQEGSDTLPEPDPKHLICVSGGSLVEASAASNPAYAPNDHEMEMLLQRFGQFSVASTGFPDCLITAVSSNFTDLTEYNADEVLQKNCKLLQSTSDPMLQACCAARIEMLHAAARDNLEVAVPVLLQNGSFGSI